MITTDEFSKTVKEVEETLVLYSKECKEGKRQVEDWNALYYAMNYAYDILQNALKGSEPFSLADNTETDTKQISTNKF